MHQNPAVEFVTGAEPKLTVILAHGRTLNPAYMRALAERLALPDIRYIFPAADGNSWYPQSFLSPLADNEPGLVAAIARYEQIVAGLLAESVEPSKLVIGGFSQGACLTAEYLHRHPRPLGGVILWTGGLIGPDGTDWTMRPELAGMPAYLTTSMTDPYIPAARVRRTVEWLRGSGAQVTAKIFAERKHEVIDEEIASARNLLLGLIQPAAARRTA
jgi:predicted esterase